MHSYFPSVVSFSNSKDSIQTPPNDSDDYGQQLADAVDVQEIDTNLYASKQLWLPLGSRGAFGGQVREGDKKKKRYQSTQPIVFFPLDCCSSITCRIPYYTKDIHGPCKCRWSSSFY